ncbi:uncharacterized protein LOC106069571 [Biomphalaria glabrata]|uniref:Uncharacterized protein LOC106069571 n=1 Tax=Biomphalaria glabrata TaxID=6526 RepID=A0A9W2ZZ25_BIOGL|nr:uncharacterized protein LOC106069571 [Biomphalaria glabrata]
MAESKRSQSKSCKRRDKENELIGELSSLLPLDLSRDSKLDKLSVLRMTLAYLKCRKNIESDESDLRECLAKEPDTDLSKFQNSSVPLAMLDNDGKLIAGTLAEPAHAFKNLDIILPESVLSSLEQTLFSSNSDDAIDVDKRYEKLQKYKEGLEKGMREFLSQAPRELSDSKNITKGTKKIKNIKDRQKEAPVADNGDMESGSNFYVSSCNAKKIAKFRSQIPIDNESSLMLEAVPGFFLLLDRNKKVLFVSENIKDILGVTQMNVIGQDISNFIYEKDFTELEKQMCDEQFSDDKDRGVRDYVLNRTFYLAMNFCFQKNGSRQKNSGQKLFRWDAKVRIYRDTSSQEIRVKGLLSLCRPVRDVSISDFQCCEFVFYSKHGNDYKIVFCDPRVHDILGYDPKQFLGTDGFSLKHPCDVMMCHYKHKELPSKGTGDSGYYRLLAKTGKWMWAISHYTVCYDKEGQLTYVNVNTYIVSMEEAKCILSREKEDYQRMKNEGFDFDLTYYGLSKPTLATWAANKKLKRKRSQKKADGDEVTALCVTNLESGSTDIICSSISSMSSSDAGLEAHLYNETRIQPSTLDSPPLSQQSGSEITMNSSPLDFEHVLSSSGGSISSNLFSPDIVEQADTDERGNLSLGNREQSVHTRVTENNSCDLTSEISHILQDTETSHTLQVPETSHTLQVPETTHILQDDDITMLDLDIDYLSLPSVNLDSPNIDVEMLMSSTDELQTPALEEGLFTSTLEWTPLTSPKGFAKTSTLERCHNSDFESTQSLDLGSTIPGDFEVQSILNYFMPDRGKTTERDISSIQREGKGHDSQLSPNLQLLTAEHQVDSKNTKSYFKCPQNTCPLTTATARDEAISDNHWTMLAYQQPSSQQWTTEDSRRASGEITLSDVNHNNRSSKSFETSKSLETLSRTETSSCHISSSSEPQKNKQVSKMNSHNISLLSHNEFSQCSYDDSLDTSTITGSDPGSGLSSYISELCESDLENIQPFMSEEYNETRNTTHLAEVSWGLHNSSPLRSDNSSITSCLEVDQRLEAVCENDTFDQSLAQELFDWMESCASAKNEQLNDIVSAPRMLNHTISNSQQLHCKTLFSKELSNAFSNNTEKTFQLNPSALNINIPNCRGKHEQTLSSGNLSNFQGANTSDVFNKYNFELDSGGHLAESISNTLVISGTEDCDTTFGKQQHSTDKLNNLMELSDILEDFL